MCTSVCVCVCARARTRVHDAWRGMVAMVSAWRPEDNFWESLLTFHYVVLGDQMLVARLGGKLLAEPSRDLLIIKKKQTFHSPSLFHMGKRAVERECWPWSPVCPFEFSLQNSALTGYLVQSLVSFLKRR